MVVVSLRGSPDHWGPGCDPCRNKNRQDKGMVEMESNWIDPGTGPGYSPDDERAPVVKPDDMPLLPSEEQVQGEGKALFERLLDERANRGPAVPETNPQEYLDLAQATDNAKRWPELRSAQDVAAEQ